MMDPKVAAEKIAQLQKSFASKSGTSKTDTNKLIQLNSFLQFLENADKVPICLEMQSHLLRGRW